MKKNIIIGILIVIILVNGGYIVYSNINNNKQVCDNQNIEINDTVTMNIENKNEIQTIINGEIGYELIISKDGSAYLNLDGVSNAQVLKSLEENYIVENACSNENTEICPVKDQISAIKLNISNVISAYDVVEGQDSAYGDILYFIKEDGTVSKLAIGQIIFNETNSLTIEDNYNNLKNIITIVQTFALGTQSGAYQTIAIESNGVQHIM